jgi:anti-sigma factor RsiW
LEQYFEGSLPRRRREEAAAHIAACAACAAELDQIQKMTAALEAAPRAVPREDLVKLIAARAAELPAPGRRRALTLGWHRLGALAAGVAGTLAVITYGLQMLLTRNDALLASAVVWTKGGASHISGWVVAMASSGANVWRAADGIGQGLLLATKASLPTAGIYAAVEIGILLAVILVFHLGRRNTLVQRTLLI